MSEGQREGRSRRRRLLMAAAATLACSLAGHAMLETARDALFLRALPAERLPWAYLAIALLVVLTTPLVERWGGSRSRALGLLLAAGAAGNVGFYFAVEGADPAALFALYVWGGWVTTQVVVQFWLLLSRELDVASAKRLFARVGAAGLLGATAGSGLASLLLLSLPARGLLCASASLWVAAAALSGFLERGSPEPSRRAPEPESRTRPAPLRQVLSDPYALRLVTLALGVAVLATGVDFVFKATAAQELPGDRLAQFFARYHAAVGALSLAFQLALTPWLLQRLGVTRALLLLPGSVALGAASVATLGGLLPALVTRATDGVLRHSLQRAGLEILHLPLGEEVRGSVRSLAASLGHRGGQAAASLALLVGLDLGATRADVAWATTGAALGVLVLVSTLRGSYVERFRQRVRQLDPEIPLEGPPPLDLQSLEALVAALSSPDEGVVLASLDLLERYRRQRLVPPLILYHPSPRVVRRALELFRGERGPEAETLIAKLAAHGEATVRAAALHDRAVDAPRLRHLLARDPAPSVRAAALAELAARGDVHEDEAREALLELCRDAPPDVRRTLGAMAGALPGDLGEALARALAAHADGEGLRELATSLARAPRPAHVAVAIDLLAHPASREGARRLLVSLGLPALEELARRLRDPGVPRPVRRHLPRSVSRFASPEAAAVLVRALEDERDPRVRFKILRGLGRMRADDPGLPVDAASLHEEALAALRRATEVLAFRAVIGEDAGAHGSYGALLLRLLEEKEDVALERVFRILHILDPAAGYRALFEAMRHGGAQERAAALEVLEHALEGTLRAGLCAILAEGTPAERIARLLGFHAPPEVAEWLEADGDPAARDAVRESHWERLLRDHDPVLRSLARRVRCEGEERAA